MLKRASEIREKEIININDGRRLGFVSDIEFDTDEGSVQALVIPVCGKLLGIFGKEEEIVIPWSKIKMIGDDIILVDMDEKNIRKLFE